MKLHPLRTFCIIALFSLGVTTSLYAKEESIKIKYLKDADIEILTNVAETQNVIVLKKSDLDDNVIIEEKLSTLSPETKEIVLSAIENAKSHLSDGITTDIKTIIDDGNGDLIKSGKVHVIKMESAQHPEDEVKHKVFFSINGDEDSVLKGHTDAIVKLIEKGEFSQEELDQIQLAIDKKR